MRFAPAALFLLSLAPLRAGAVEITAGAAGSPIGFAGGAGLELGIGDSAGVEVRGSFFSYDYSVPDYEEKGSGPMAGVRARYYAQDTGNATRLWLAAGLSAASVSIESEETDGGAVVEHDERDATLLLVEGALGYKILLGDERFVLDPQLSLGYFVSPDSELDVFAAIGLSAGVRF